MGEARIVVKGGGGEARIVVGNLGKEECGGV